MISAQEMFEDFSGKVSIVNEEYKISNNRLKRDRYEN